MDNLPNLAKKLADTGVEIQDGGLDKGWLQISDPDGNALVFEEVREP